MNFLVKKLRNWCNENKHSFWIIERKLLNNIQPKSGTLVDWLAISVVFHTKSLRNSPEDI